MVIGAPTVAAGRDRRPPPQSRVDTGRRRPPVEIHTRVHPAIVAPLGRAVIGKAWGRLAAV